MRKLFFIVLLCLFCVFNISLKDDYSYLWNDETYDIYTVSIDNLNTKNMINYFSVFGVINIYPLVNLIYKNQIGNVSYKLRNCNLSNEIGSFSNYYLSLIKK